MEPLKFKWQKMVASEMGPKSPTRRHVLLTMSLYMDEDGENCFPSVNALCEATALGRAAIIRHIQAAVSAGWLKRSLAGKKGKAWRRSNYQAQIPSMNQEGGIPEIPRSKGKVVSLGDHDKQKVVSLRREGGIPEEKNGELHLLYEQSYNSQQNASALFAFYVSEIQPARKSKSRAVKNISAYLKRKIRFETLKSAILNYKSTLKGTDSKYRKDPANFFGINEPYAADFYPENFEPVSEKSVIKPQVKEFDFSRQFHEE